MSTRAEYRAIVTNVSDPEQRGRVKVRCDMLLSNGQELEEWIPPVLPMNGATSVLFLLPEVGDEVVLTSTGPDSENGIHDFVLNPEWAYEGSPLPEGVTPPALLTGNYGKRIGFVFSTGGATTALVLDRAASVAMLIASTVRLGIEGASHPVTLADLLRPILVTLFQSVQTAFNTHTHPGVTTGPGSTSTPTVPMSLGLTDLQGSTWQSAKVMASGQSE